MREMSAEMLAKARARGRGRGAGHRQAGPGPRRHRGGLRAREAHGDRGLRLREPLQRRGDRRDAALLGEPHREAPRRPAAADRGGDAGSADEVDRRARGGARRDSSARAALDAAILEWIHGHSHPALDAVCVVSWALGVLRFCAPAILLAMAWHLSRGERREALAWLAVGAGAAILPELVKAVVARARPTLWPWLIPTSGFSFPSGHAVAGAALYPFLGWLLLRRGARPPRVPPRPGRRDRHRPGAPVRRRPLAERRRGRVDHGDGAEPGSDSLARAARPGRHLDSPGGLL